MVRQVEIPISPEQLGNASRNYIDCLNLHPSSQILIITDKLPGIQEIDPHLKVRRDLSAMLRDEIGKDHKVAMIEFDGKQSAEELKSETERALNELNKLEGRNSAEHTTVIFLGEQWKERTGIYAGADEFGISHRINVNVALSLGFSTGDCRVMSELDKNKMRSIEEINSKFEAFFYDHPNGKFKVTTHDDEGNNFILNLDYDTSKAPFRSDMGMFDGRHESPISEFKHTRGINVPGGEIYGIGYPYKSTNGKFLAEGLIFVVENGLVKSIEFKEGQKIEIL